MKIDIVAKNFMTFLHSASLFRTIVSVQITSRGGVKLYEVKPRKELRSCIYRIRFRSL